MWASSDVWLYVYKKTYWDENKFKFKEGFYHEDFGLIPEVIIKASKVSCIDEFLYHYVQNEESIMHLKDAIKNEKKAFDTLYQGIAEINNLKEWNIGKHYKSIFNSFIANSIFIKLNSIKGKAKEEYIKLIKDNNIIDYLLNDTIKRKVKKQFYKIKYKI